MAGYATLCAALQAQRGHRLPLVALGFGTGVGLYFALPVEPSVPALIGLGVLAALALALGWWRRGDWGGIPVMLACVALGLSAAAVRSAQVAAPVLGFRYYGPVEGRVVKVDVSASYRPRVILSEVRLANLAPARTPAQVRLSFSRDIGFDLVPGQVIAATAHLGPPQGPTEPGGFDFQRHAWFLGIGAFGYSRAPPVLLAPPPPGPSIARLRADLTAGLMARMPERTGGVAAAITTGDRSAIPEATLEALRVSNLAHLLAISGLHMGLLTGFIFASARIGLAMVPGVSLRWPVKKLAVLIALAAAVAYLLLSGMAVATQRAFVMASVALVAILADRRAISLRALAMAALIILAWRPEALVGPGFQMSFAATIALVIAFRALRDRNRASIWRQSGVAGWFFALFLSSFVAGLATAPFSAAHFNMVGQYGLLANILSVPIMGIVVMPLMVAAALLAPLGLEAWPLWGVHLGLSWILGVADWVAALGGSKRFFPAPQPFVLPLFALGALWCILWQGHARWAGAALSVAACLAWSGVERPALLVAEGGDLLGQLTPQGRALSRARGAGFVAETWLAADGQGLDQAKAAEIMRNWEDVPQGIATFVVLQGRDRAARLSAACQPGVVLLSYQEDTPENGPCLALTPKILRQTGALAIDAQGKVTTARARQGARPWVPRPIRATLDLRPTKDTGAP